MLRDFYIFSNGRMKRKDNTFYFINEEEKKRSLPIAQIDNLYVFGQVDFNTKLLNFLNQHQIHVHFFNYYGFYSGSFTPRESNLSGFTLVQQSAHYLDTDKRLILAKAFVSSAVFHMLRTLRGYKQITAEMLGEIIRLTPQISQASTIQQLMGVEGLIRQEYYSMFNYILPPEFSFYKRSKKPPQDEINALISFGNSLCYTTVLSEIYKTQLNPTISYLHEPSSKRYSLSLDIAEIFKPLIVDPLIFTLVNKKMISLKHFESLDEMVLLNEQGRKKFLQAWEGKLGQTVMHRRLKRKVSYKYFIRLECYKLIKHMIGDELYKPLKAWW
ncbi:type I-B CRISPR-associated endonuclease Cas1b [Bacillus cytotoxicus]|uniref:type I-B CRISPR-associated endonuclease Cas1b n=1 Tax=Bacillus cytotoxicus TaxID=580165 RepID=UPI0006600B44|nr:type I-B CRISPR-associated endonuclease Cas1b [Bacillus cytotoxicus]AWC32896.1 type I-B CRISPR-associated endonuclease Cas1 [Bacillus cytotoxicus]AWC36920.1 type I-B CRISPR-associated endonuclease Cas1 [Bacillus cytotoxicus]AWC61183.1 type I-B CRISPR-associated endonuclease Cas1 [Bacillus cytotoxicus]KMT48366.1 CRISPR-associated protein Cas1 [Bacillus cytotoxicus]MDH2881416.1 type I-B CRISPR-associated endonuclease Cas1b [Bacillus cytotoxicus]